jgi:hypothetical protein
MDGSSFSKFVPNELVCQGLFGGVLQNKNIICLPKLDRPKKILPSQIHFCCKIPIFFFISGFSTWPWIPYKILVLQVKSLSRLQQHYKILAEKRLSDTDEIFFDILSIYHYKDITFLWMEAHFPSLFPMS